MDKLISVIVPAYNIEQYIGRCIESIINQSYPYLEIIVVNDGSLDCTGEIIDKFAAIDNRIKPIHKKNEGVSIARNTGLNMATGDYIGFVDGDDVIENDMYELLLNTALKNNSDIAHCGYKMVFPSRVDEYYGTQKIVVQDRYRALKDLLVGYPIEPGLWNKIYKKELFNGIKLNPEIRINEDLLLNFYLFSRANKSVFIDETKYHYILRENSASTSKINIKKMQDPVKVWEEIKRMLLVENSKLYNIAQSRYIMVLTNNVLIMPNQLESKALSFQIECRKKLKKEKKVILDCKYLSKKRKLLGIFSIYFPTFTRFIKEILERISGSKFKYVVK